MADEPLLLKRWCCRRKCPHIGEKGENICTKCKLEYIEYLKEKGILE